MISLPCLLNNRNNENGFVICSVEGPKWMCRTLDIDGNLEPCEPNGLDRLGGGKVMFSAAGEPGQKF